MLQSAQMADSFFLYKILQDLDLFRHAIRKTREDPSESLMMIDAIQRLGIDYIFEEEIEAILEDQFIFLNDSEHHEDLHEVALRFRLLRQQGHFVSAGSYVIIINDLYVPNELYLLTGKNYMDMSLFLVNIIVTTTKIVNEFFTIRLNYSFNLNN